MNDKKIVEDFLYEKESYLVVDAAKEVWRELGGAFKEKIAEKAYAITLQSKNKNLKVENQKRINIFYREQFVDTYVPDLIVNEVILIELKCKPFIVQRDYQQL